MFQGVTRWHQRVQADLSWWRHPLCQPCVVGPSQHCQPVPVSWRALVHVVWNLVLSSVLSIWVQPKINHSQSQQGSRYEFSCLVTLSGLSVWSLERPVCTGMQCFQNIPDTRSWERERYYMTIRTLLFKFFFETTSLHCHKFIMQIQNMKWCSFISPHLIFLSHTGEVLYHHSSKSVLYSYKKMSLSAHFSHSWSSMCSKLIA